MLQYNLGHRGCEHILVATVCVPVMVLLTQSYTYSHSQKYS